MLWVWFWVLVATMLPLGFTLLLVHIAAVIEHGQALLDRMLPQRRQRPQAQPVERLAADLHRLAVHIDTIERSQEMHRVARLRAASLAYDDALLSACRTLEVAVPETTPLHPVERLQTEAALAQAGLVW
ncbi:MAG: hypothetical protein QOH68_3084 [Nocardioidaceae bacterium]|nr:hypothetical protein [Nocardioidaceae bacterium]